MGFPFVDCWVAPNPKICQVWEGTHVSSRERAIFHDFQHKTIAIPLVWRKIKPHLQLLSGETLQYKTANRYDNARLDIAANGFWGGRFERSYFDVRIFTLVHPQINPYTLHTDVMTRKRDVNTNNGFMK